MDNGPEFVEVVIGWPPNEYRIRRERALLFDLDPTPIADMAGIYADMGFTLDEWLDQP